MVGIALLLGAAGIAAQADTVTFTTDITGANVQIDILNTETYDFVINPGHTLTDIFGEFDIKKGNTATEDILFSVYNDFNGTGHVNGTFTPNGIEVGVATLTPADVDQNFGNKEFAIHSLNLLPGNYSVALHSLASDNGTGQYFFKNQGFTSTSNGDVINIGTVPSAETPEPSGLLAGLGFLGTIGGGILRARRRRFAHRKGAAL